MLTLMNNVEKDAATRTINVEKDAATRTNTGKTEKETRPNQPAREPSPPSPSPIKSLFRWDELGYSCTTRRKTIRSYNVNLRKFYLYLMYY